MTAHRHYPCTVKQLLVPCPYDPRARFQTLYDFYRLGKACAEYQDKAFRNLPCKRIQCDEIWSFCYAKEKNVPKDKKGIFGYGDVWTFTAIDAETKLVPTWLVGMRNLDCAYAFIGDLKDRPGRPQKGLPCGQKPAPGSRRRFPDGRILRKLPLAASAGCGMPPKPGSFPGYL